MHTKQILNNITFFAAINVRYHIIIARVIPGDYTYDYYVIAYVYYAKKSTVISLEPINKNNTKEYKTYFNTTSSSSTSTLDEENQDQTLKDID